MLNCLLDLFQSPTERKRFAAGLPLAFSIVRQRMPAGNPAVGILREHVMIGYFFAVFGRDKITLPEAGNEREYDLILCGDPVSIKTVTGDVGVKILWTADTDQAQREIRRDYNPHSDILLVNIYWEQKRDSVFLIPTITQTDVMNSLGREIYLSSATGTNNRGIEIKRKAITELKRHPDTLCIEVDWALKNQHFPEPWDEWEKYWQKLIRNDLKKKR